LPPISSPIPSSIPDNLVSDTIYNKGSKCSEAGTKYEIDVYNVIKNTTLNGAKFNTQKIEELGGSSAPKPQNPRKRWPK